MSSSNPSTNSSLASVGVGGENTSTAVMVPPSPHNGFQRLPLAIQAQLRFIMTHLLVVLVLALLGNAALVLVIRRGNRAARRHLSPVQLLLLHTCVADVLFAVLTLGSEVALLAAYPRFPGPDWACRAVHYGQMLPLYASPFLLVAIAADRYQAICRPLDNFRQTRYWRPNCFAAVAWSLAALFSVPQILVWSLDNHGHCGTIYGARRSLLKNVYVIWFNTIAWLLPSMLAAAFYYRVCKAVWMSHRLDLFVPAGVNCVAVTQKAKSTAGRMKKDKKKDKEKISSSALPTPCDAASSGLLTEDYVNRLRNGSCAIRRQTTEFDRKRTQTVRLTMTIIALNFILWTPFCVCNILQAFLPHLLHRDVNIFLGILGNLNSCVNPWIYILFNLSHAKRAFFYRRRKGLRSETECASLACTARPTPTLVVTTPHLNSGGGGGHPHYRCASAKSTTDTTTAGLASDGHHRLAVKVNGETAHRNGSLSGQSRSDASRSASRPASRESV